MSASVDVRARGGRGVQTDFSVRGAGFGQVLILVEGVRLNDVQSGHHNGDIPVPLDAVERIEVLHGPGASLFGADAFSGTINVITRRDADSSATLLGGSNGLAGGRAQWGAAGGGARHVLTASSERSGGFTYDRDFVTTAARSQSTFGSRTRVAISWLGKEFGANNFYGGNAPSREWTDQTLVSLNQRIGAGGGWEFAAVGSYRIRMVTGSCSTRRGRNCRTTGTARTRQ